MIVPKEYPRDGIPNKSKKVRIFKVVARDGAVCKHCGESDSKKLTIDHVVPKHKGGLNTIENMQILCRKCHDKKDYPLLNNH